MDRKFKSDQLSVLLELFIKKGTEFTWNKKDYSRERGAIIRLLKEFPDFEFFYTLTDLQNRFNSLLGLLSKSFKPRLQIRYKLFLENKQRKSNYKIEDKPVVNIEVNNKPKNQIEFLKS